MSFVKSMAEVMNRLGGTFIVYDAEVLFVFWETRPEIVERLLPPPLEPPVYPLVTAFVANYPRTNLLPPYREGALFVSARHEGVEGTYCLAMPVTGDMAMAGGREYFGFPKKMGAIALAREGDLVHGRLERYDQTFFEVTAELGSPPNDAGFEAFVENLLKPEADGGVKFTVYNFKCFPAPNRMGFDYEPRLIRQPFILRSREVSIAHAQVALPEAANDPWFELEIVKLLGALYTVGDNELCNGEVVAEVDTLTFAPYAFTKWDG